MGCVWHLGAQQIQRPCSWRFQQLGTKTWDTTSLDSFQPRTTFSAPGAFQQFPKVFQYRFNMVQLHLFLHQGHYDVKAYKNIAIACVDRSFSSCSGDAWASFLSASRSAPAAALGRWSDGAEELKGQVGTDATSLQTLGEWRWLAKDGRRRQTDG